MKIVLEMEDFPEGTISGKVRIGEDGFVVAVFKPTENLQKFFDIMQAFAQEKKS